MHVSQILERKGDAVATTTPDATVADLVKILKEKKIGAVVIVDADGGLEGIVSERDVVRGLPDHGAELMNMRVDSIMTRDVKTCSPDDAADQVMMQMSTHRFRHMPVARDGALCGIVSIGDVVKCRLEELEAESGMLREYIGGGFG